MTTSKQRRRSRRRRGLAARPNARRRAGLHARGADPARQARARRPRAGRPRGGRKQRGRARLERALGPPTGSRTSSRGCSIERGLRARVRAVRPARPERSTGGSTCASSSTFTIDPDTAKDFDDAISVRREGDGIRALGAHRRRLRVRPRRLAARPRRRRARASRRTCPGLVAPMLPHELADDACTPAAERRPALRHGRDPFDGALQAGEPRFYRSVIRANERLTYGQARGDPRRARERGGGRHEGARLAETTLARAPAPPLRARRAADRSRRRSRSRSTASGGVARRVARVGAARARARRGADDPRERSGRAACSRAAARGALPRARAAGATVGPAPAREAGGARGPDAARARRRTA